MAGRKRVQQGSAETARPKKQQKTHTTSSVITRAGKRQNLSNAVFLTTELLENVLRFLPMKDLLISQRVARKWRAVINESKELQQALFMVPREADTAWEIVTGDPLEDDEDGGREILAINTVNMTKDHPDTQEKDKVYVRHGELNPMFFEQRTAHRDFWQLLKDGCIIFHLKKEYQRPRAQRTWMKRPEASWRKMLILQPPTQQFWYHFVCKSKSSPLRYDDEIWNSDMTVAGVMDKIDEIERLDKDVFSFGDHFMSIDDSGLFCPLEGDQVEIDKWTFRRRILATFERVGLRARTQPKIEEANDPVDSSEV
ncbi:hypothetical protein PRZ48_014986 [Zasmidium cellare]|uniref:F-box domain-containing protein n=1 Tax=Zasmidium cellare TaxID=395010 RepID=A0ABR0DXB5_ZASCE|nr:hypothetical protein PRZ48_014986 [Zasmidium cellare]